MIYTALEGGNRQPMYPSFMIIHYALIYFDIK